MKCRHLLLAVVLLSLPWVGVQARDRKVTDQEFEARLKEATRLHDEGKYEDAIGAFKALLETRPNDQTVLCELANSSMTAGHLDDAIGYAQKGLDQHLPGPSADFCAVVLGSCYDERGDLGQGEKVFRRALQDSPHQSMLLFNLGVNLVQQKKASEAVAFFQQDLTEKPLHASAWRALAIACKSSGERGRAFAAFARFLTIEPDSKRSAEPARQLWDLLFGNVQSKVSEADPSKTDTTITLPAADDGDSVSSGARDLSLSIVAAGRNLDEWKDKSDTQFFAHAFESVLSIFEESAASDKKEDPFWRDEVMPYFREARHQKHLEAMAYDVRRSLAHPEVMKWLDEHAEALKKYRDWSSSWHPPAAR